jgi:psiF repeat-containing protein
MGIFHAVDNAPRRRAPPVCASPFGMVNVFPGARCVRREPFMLIRFICAAGAVVLVNLGTPASALTPEEKMETCKIGADAQKLTGAKRKRFLARCMADGDSPPGKGK